MRRLLPYLAFSYVSLVGATTRLMVVGEERRRRLRAGAQRFLYAFWHQRQVFFTYSHRGERAAVLVSRSRDGELIAETMRLSRIASCRGSSSRGGAAAARSMIESVRQGYDLAITPDGPKGPAREVKPGALFLARELGIPILPLTNALSLRLEFSRSWDHFQLPLPFGRAAIVYGEPIWVGPDDQLEEKAAELKASLDLITAEAERLVGR
ncbi:MAG: lysophospholipid acyltransferase family protein [Elusimicrobia bacterium]|nr:lysophospholipid acyltransferase family protein [Elusimicrobiota bacterium]MDE2237577.1 lysophospholipid acyltransferase family protein [Elusimicrobiota bacterium]MDE2424875.1 lysophospholipid acyltransferase family protein [Elusimicrobiota bacterium]